MGFKVIFCLVLLQFIKSTSSKKIVATKGPQMIVHSLKNVTVLWPSMLLKFHLLILSHCPFVFITFSSRIREILSGWKKLTISAVIQNSCHSCLDNPSSVFLSSPLGALEQNYRTHLHFTRLPLSISSRKLIQKSTSTNVYFISPSLSLSFSLCVC